jgi:hypothetical protein
LRGRGLPRLVTTTYDFDEVVTYLNSRGLHTSAVKTGKRLLGSRSVELGRVGDRLSFTLMRERGISVALAFDRHFE